MLFLLVAQFSICKANTPQVLVRSGEKYLEVWDGAEGFQPLYINGVNLSGVLPGHHATEPCTDQATYLRWFGLLHEMNANTIRVFDTMPREFYSALAGHNTSNPGSELWLIQGVWVELPTDGDFSCDVYSHSIKHDIYQAVDAVHDTAGQADVSEWLLGFLFGREWEARSVIQFNEMYPLQTAYQGTFISAGKASPMECWLAEMCDALVSYETALYEWQHPVSFINWVATDPIDHLQGYKDALGEDFEVPWEAMEDFLVNDSVSLSVNNLYAEDTFGAGLYASYHVYPYYPDFISRQPQYAGVYDGEGKNSFLGYLEDLKSRYPDTPLLITEYGLPSSPFAVHRHPQGWGHGGMSEQRVAEVLPRLTNAIADSGCGGGAVFALMDGWFKRVWLWNKFYSPPDESRLWFNLLDPEQNYGLLALEPQNESQVTLSGNPEEWERATKLTAGSQPPATKPPVVWATHDEGYLYLRVGLPGFTDWQFGNHRLYIGLNVDGDATGNFAWPFPLQYTSGQGMDLMLVLSGGQARIYQASTFRYWEAMRRWDENVVALPATKLSEANSFGWILPQVQTNSVVLGSLGQVVAPQAWPINPLRQGSLVGGGDYEAHAVWNVSAGTNMLELRIPWMLAGFSAPQLKRVVSVLADGEIGYSESGGIGIEVLLSTSSGSIESMSQAVIYAWDGWGSDGISFVERLKPVYYSLQAAYAELNMR